MDTEPQKFVRGTGWFYWLDEEKEHESQKLTASGIGVVRTASDQQTATNREHGSLSRDIARVHWTGDATD